MCLSRPRKTYSRRTTAYKVVNNILGWPTGVFQTFPYNKGKNVSNRPSTKWLPDEKKYGIGRGFHLFLNREDAIAYAQKQGSCHEVWEVSIKRQHEVAYGIYHTLLLREFPPMCVYMEFTYRKTIFCTK